MKIKYLLYIFAIFLFIGCGYKPTSYYAKNEISGLVYVKLGINVDNSDDSIFVKDTVNSMLINQFDTKLTNNKSKATSFVYVTLNKISYSAISTDNLGFTNRYRATVSLNFKYNKKGEKINSFTVSNYDDYFVDNETSITDTNKQNAIAKASKKALEEIFSKIALINSTKE